MKGFKLVVVTVAAFATISAIGCAKPPDEEGPPPPQSNRNATQTDANVGNRRATLLHSNTLRGDVERAGLAVMRAHNLLKQQKWIDAEAKLRVAQSHIEKALERKPRLRDDFEAARTAILKTIATVEGRGSDIEAKFTEIQTRISGLKVYTSE